MCLLINSGLAQSDLGTQLKNLSLTTYLNQPIDTLIAHLPTVYNSSFSILPTEPITNGASLEIDYPGVDDYWVEIDITDPQYITVKRNLSVHAEVAWPFSLLRKEKVGRIQIHRGGYEIINQAEVSFI